MATYTVLWFFRGHGVVSLKPPVKHLKRLTEDILNCVTLWRDHLQSYLLYLSCISSIGSIIHPSTTSLCRNSIFTVWGLVYQLEKQSLSLT